MDLDTPIPAPIFANKPFKLSYLRFASFIIIAAILALFLVSHKSPRQPDPIPFFRTASFDYFKHFEGHQDCGVVSTEIYQPPIGTFRYCKSRAVLLEALTGGGRHGFDTPFFPNGCHYRWLTTAEICMVLERFDAVIFLGDTMVHSIYSAFNILLRENVALGALKQWEMSDSERGACRCDNQFAKGECARFAVTSNEEVARNDGGRHSSPYFCDRTVHTYSPLTASPSTPSHETLKTLIQTLPQTYKPIPIIHSLSLGTSLSYTAATSSMDEWLSFFDSLNRKLPFLWLGPAAAGHLKPPALILGQGNNALWHFNVEMGKEARAREMEVLGMYNATLQASSWDGTGYGARVALMQAMMVINWLSRLETT
ncbi:MAG: hypothetical protein M1839_004918 [Geoglossum umbratile]|nr:MAG: hypothetical protein M1839_004918 [Geoglossum umbratile]